MDIHKLMKGLHDLEKLGRDRLIAEGRAALGALKAEAKTGIMNLKDKAKDRIAALLMDLDR